MTPQFLSDTAVTALFKKRVKSTFGFMKIREKSGIFEGEGSGYPVRHKGSQQMFSWTFNL